MDVLEAVQAQINQARPDLLPVIAPLLESVRQTYGGDTDYIKKSKSPRCGVTRRTQQMRRKKMHFA